MLWWSRRLRCVSADLGARALRLWAGVGRADPVRAGGHLVPRRRRAARHQQGRPQLVAGAPLARGRCRRHRRAARRPHTLPRAAGMAHRLHRHREGETRAGRWAPAKSRGPNTGPCGMPACSCSRFDAKTRAMHGSTSYVMVVPSIMLVMHHVIIDSLGHAGRQSANTAMLSPCLTVWKVVSLGCSSGQASYLVVHPSTFFLHRSLVTLQTEMNLSECEIRLLCMAPRPRHS